MSPDLYLLRHGQTFWNAEGRLHGGLDSPLTPLGIRQARRQADLVAGIAGARLSSPQGRARHSAALIFGTGGATFCDDLVEIGIGRFAGQLLDDLRRAEPALFAGHPLAWYDRCPGGEGLAGLAIRCRRVLDALTGPALIVGHGITLRMIGALAVMPGTTPGPADLGRIPVAQGAVCVIRHGRAVPRRHPDDRDQP